MVKNFAQNSENLKIDGVFFRSEGGMGPFLGGKAEWPFLGGKAGWGLFSAGMAGWKLPPYLRQLFLDNFRQI